MKNHSRFCLSLSFLAAFVLMVSLASCAGGYSRQQSGGGDTTANQPPKDDFAENCKAANAISLTIKDYKYQMTGKYEYATANFEVKQSSWTQLNDFTAEMKLMNYASGELVGDRKDDQIDIVVTFTAKKGKKIGPGVYPYMKYESDLVSKVNVITSKGTVWFNWLAGMPDQGNVVLDYAADNKACGNFALAVENAKSEMVGTVRLNGTFRIGGRFS